MKKRQIAAYVGIGIICFSIIFLSGFILLMNKESSYDIGNKGKSINNSIYTLYNGKIYANVPSNGEYLIDNADPESFKTLYDEFNYKERQFAIDKNYSYCGNRIIPKFNPKTAKSLGHSYFTDKENTIYCAPFTKINDELSSWETLRQNWLYGWSLGNKQEVYYYPMVFLPVSTTPYYSLLKADLLTDGQHVFFRGYLMPEAKPNKLAAIDIIRIDDSRWESRDFHHDDINVYYQQNKLSINNSENLYSFFIDGLQREAYLFEPKSGSVVINNIEFPAKFTPYQLMSRYGGHVNHVLFLSKHGVYFYDQKQEKIRRAGDNPFLQGNWKEIAPFVFTYNNKTYYLQDSSSWGGRKSPGLISRSTTLYLLDEDSSEDWIKIGNLAHSHYGEVWKKGEHYYYFDRLGSSQLVKYTIYIINGKKVLDSLLNDDLQPQDIRKMEDDNRLINVSGTEVFRAKTQYKRSIKNRFDFF